jgi:bacillithiol synthase
MMADPMECHCISATQLPHATRLYSSYIGEFRDVSEFFAHAPTFDSILQQVEQAPIDRELRSKVAAVLKEQNRAFGADSAVQASLDDFANGATAIVSGQQVGLFSGPSFTIYKALSALRLAEDLGRMGKPAVAIFWLATEDHDLAEINHCLWPVRAGAERLDLASNGGSKRRVGELALGDGVSEVVERAAGSLQGPAAAEIAAALRDSYRPGETYGSAFGKLLARIFAGTGLILLDPLSPQLHALAAPLFRSALEHHQELAAELLDRSETLNKRGLHSQVKVTEQTTLLFVDQDGERVPLRASGQDFSLGSRNVSLQQLTDLLGTSPESFSANVLLRPVMQDLLLSTAAYVAGPAEIAYFAQGSVVYKRLLGRMPVMMPRASFTLVEPHVASVLRKYDLALPDLFAGERPVRARMESAMLPEGLAGRFEKGQETLQKLMQDLREPVEKLDGTLAGALETSEKKILYQFAHLQEKVARAIAFRSGVLESHQRLLMELLYPNGSLQERALNFLPILAAHGRELLDELGKRSGPGSFQHQVLYL